MQTVIFRTARLWLVPLLLLLFIAACAPNEAAPPTRRPTRPPAVALLPTKVARNAPTATPEPTRTPRPTRTRIPTKEPTSTPIDTPVTKQTQAPTARVAAAESVQENIPATAKPTQTPEPSPTNAKSWEYTWDIKTDAPCDVNGGGDFGVLGAPGWGGRPPETNPDLNMAVRGYKVVNALRALVDYTGDTDGGAPQLWGLFADRRTPEIAHTFGVFDWDWGSMTRGDLVEDYEVTMTGFQMSDGETVFTPDFGHEIGEGYVALVLYADAHRITLKYTGEDNVVHGYTLHLEGVCVYSNLLNLYNARNAAGRGALPALRPGQPIGYMPGTELGVSIQDSGAFLDPRSRKDWWQGR